MIKPSITLQNPGTIISIKAWTTALVIGAVLFLLYFVFVLPVLANIDRLLGKDTIAETVYAYTMVTVTMGVFFFAVLYFALAEIRSHVRQAHAEIITRLDAFKENLVKLSLSCPACQKLAQPLPDTGNRYRCSCGIQFASDHHGLLTSTERDPREMWFDESEFGKKR